MICGFCLRRSERVAVTSYGTVCPECLPGLESRELALYHELIQEESTGMPPFLDIEDFERLVLKFAIHWLARASLETIRHLRESQPSLLRPRMLALFMKERIIGKIPMMYVSAMDSEGHDSLFHGGTYEFKKKVPDAVVLEAMRKAGYVTLEGDGA